MLDPEAVAVDVNETDILAFLFRDHQLCEHIRVSVEVFGNGAGRDDEVSTHTC